MGGGVDEVNRMGGRRGQRTVAISLMEWQVGDVKMVMVFFVVGL